MLDGLRAIFGLLITFGPLLTLEVAWPLAIVFASLGLVFFVFAFRVSMQAISPIELLDRGISVRGPFSRHLAWTDVTDVKLARYAVPRRSSEGWYQLTLSSRRRAIRIDSTIERFDVIVTAALDAAATNGLGFDPTTSENLKDLGHGGA